MIFINHTSRCERCDTTLEYHTHDDRTHGPIDLPTVRTVSRCPTCDPPCGWCHTDPPPLN